MKKSLLALAALTAFTGAAYAQSSVTLFGIVDLNARNLKTGSTSIKSLSQDGIASSRLGVRGVEDLGGGLRGGFWLEGAMNPDTGTPNGQTWQRRSTVSLMGGFGEIRLGRDYTPSFWNYTIFDPFGTNGVASMFSTVSNLGSGAGTQVRANNTVGYFLPSAGGLYGQVMVAAGENVAGNKYMGGRIGYAAGPVNFAAAYGKTETATTNDFKDANIGVSFQAGPAKIMGQYSKRDWGTIDQKTWLIGTVIGFGASSLKFSYLNTDGTTDALDAKAFGLGYQYDMSKRTALYATYGKTDRKVGSATDTTGYEFGVRHAF